MTLFDTVKRRTQSSLRVNLSSEFRPTLPSRPPRQPTPFMDFCSLQHLKVRRSTDHEASNPATVRLQGLVTLLTVYALRARVGFVSRRQRSWDSPFEAFPSHEVSSALPPERTHVPFIPPLRHAPKRWPERQSAVSGLLPSRESLDSKHVISALTTGGSPGLFPFQGSRAAVLRRISPTLLSRTW